MAEIEVRGISKVFRKSGTEVSALQNVNLQIDRGSIYGIIGMSGAGKSTLVRCLNYLETPTEGDVLIGGRSLGAMSERELLTQRKDIAMIFQHFNLLMQKNVLENVCFPLNIQKVKKKQAHKKAMDLLEIVGLTEKAKAYPAQLSGGQKQRVAIARALASDPKILLCDEATSALDPQTTASILELLKEINRKFGITIVIITHQMSVVRKVCTHVAIMDKGQVAEQGRMAEIFNHPKSKAARELIIRDSDRNEKKVSVKQLREAKKLRIVFSENSAFEPVIANMVLKFKTPVNILKADTKNVGGIAKGEMILGLPEDEALQKDIEVYLIGKGLEIEEVTDDVE